MLKPLIYLATQNQHKVVELLSLMGEQFSVKSLTDLSFSDEIPETGVTLSQNSLQKAKFIAERFKVCCLSDDSGLEVEALDGQPGVFSARYAGVPKNDQANLEKLLANLQGKENRKARFVTVLTYHLDGTYFQFEGSVNGQITQSPRGVGGFGYDPIFVPENQTKTFAEMSLSEKNLFAHRAKALKKFINFVDETTKC
jgi:XTP/dITP diphosphohydrolase